MKNTETESPTNNKVSVNEPKVISRELYSTRKEAKIERRTPIRIVDKTSLKEDLLNSDNPISYLSEPTPFTPLINKMPLA